MLKHPCKCLVRGIECPWIVVVKRVLVDRHALLGRVWIARVKIIDALKEVATTDENDQESAETTWRSLKVIVAIEGQADRRTEKVKIAKLVLAR